ncbi:hypothetical protein PENSTE_c007G08175 [Penicillium steckii]|uniref:Uncharacterized protein n=1 Tax=Penicillium steckii TaxID=303698 RepID=A0A1V6TD46_9EURO|nr:hypothetical protein PENSTE_c007G08175 [Penicillium steckii]
MPQWEFCNFLTIFHNTKHSTSSLSAKSGQPQSKPWRPFYLRRTVISCFIFAACGMIAALEVLNHISETRNGLASSVQNLHYIWTYTPTAVLTIISALWARTEFQAKQNAPWRSLQKPEEAEKSLLLDYDNIPPVALWKSFKNRHLHVAAGVSCSLILQLAILFSTSLFSLQGVDVRRLDVPVQLLDVFDAAHPTSSNTSSTLKPFDVLNGIQFGNMSYPSGTNANVAFQRFNSPSAPRDSVITAPIRAMEADLECEPATLEVEGWAFKKDNNSLGGVVAAYGNNTIATPSCTVFNATLDDEDIKGYSRYYSMMTPVTCDNSTSEDPYRILIYAVQYHEGKVLKNHTDRIPTFWSRKWELVLDNSVQMMCKPRLSFVNMQATANSSNSDATPNLKRLGVEDASFSKLNAKNISQLVFQGATDEYGTIGTTSGNRPIGSHPTFVDGEHEQRAGAIDYNIQLGAWIAGKTGNASTIFQDGLLEEVSRTFYRAMAAQIIHNTLVKPKVTQTSGSVVFNENRVLVMQSPLRVLEVCLGILILIATTMVLLGPGDGSPSQNPSNIWTIANVVNNSQTLRQSLCKTGALPYELLKERICGNKYYSIQNHEQDITIEVANDKLCPNTSMAQSKDASQSLLGASGHQTASFWKPFPNLWSKIPILCLIGATIIVLEVLLHISQKNDGLGKAVEDGRTHYLWTTLPSFIMMLISLFIGSLDANTRVLAPYSSLQNPKGVSFEALRTNFIDALRLTNLLRSTRTRNVAIFSTTLAALVASFLTIVTSGLYSVMEVPHTINANFTQETAFISPSYTSTKADMSDFSTVNYILTENLTYPQWTYESLVFPELSAENSLNWTAGEDLYADVHIPAIRGYSHCVFGTGSSLNASISHGHDVPLYYDSLPVSIQFDEPMAEQDIFKVYTESPPLACPLRGSNSSDTTLHSGRIWNLAVDGYFGQMGVSNCYPTKASEWKVTTTYTWGYFENYTMHHVSSMTCAGRVESVDTITRFKLPDFVIPPDHPPVTDESSAKQLTHIDGLIELNGMNSIEFQKTSQRTADNMNFDNFFIPLLEGRYKIPKEWLGNPKFDTEVQQAIRRQESIFKAQVLKTYARVAANGTLDNKPIIGNLTSTNNLRVLQDKASTRVLEAMLGFVLVLSILGSVFMNTDRVLPKNPGNIAAVGSLLADSNILKFCTFAEQSSSHVLRHCRVYLGWLEDDSKSLSSSSSEPNRGKSANNPNGYFTIYMRKDSEDIEEMFQTQVLEKKAGTRSNELAMPVVQPYRTVVEGGYI